MLHYKMLTDENGQIVIEVDFDGFEILHNPILNKGSAFTWEERRLFNLDGFLPPAVCSLAEQAERSYENYVNKPTDIERYIFLRSLQDRNEVLFYALLNAHLKEMIGIIYTPTVGQACQKYSHIFRYTRGIFLSPDNINRADEVFRSLPYRNIEAIVVTDSEGILGIGDQGIGGMGIPVGKLSLYVAGAGFNPANCLPVTLDVGTDNIELLNDPLYLGTRQRRLRGEPYFDFVDKFVQAVKRNFPRALLQWEDFSKQNAFTLLDKYRDDIPSFNDDIQGTGAVVVSGIKGALRIKKEELVDQTFVIFGAGAAGIGVARQIQAALQRKGLSEKEAREHIFVLDSNGLLLEGRTHSEDYKGPFSRSRELLQQWGIPAADNVYLPQVIEWAKPTVLLGLSGTGGAFTEDIVRAMKQHCPQPVIFPLSNPTSKAEATPENIINWTDGTAIVATGSPFPDVNYDGRVFKIGQGNNVFIFPGVGLGALTVGARIVTDEMLTAASVCLARLISEPRLSLNCVYPPIVGLHDVSLAVAVAVARKAMEQGVAARPIVPEILEETIRSKMWVPRYPRFTRGTAD
jgi:malate dehydrogenase (oxaloacetate-decarboxylating)